LSGPVSLTVAANPAAVSSPPTTAAAPIARRRNRVAGGTNVVGVAGRSMIVVMSRTLLGPARPDEDATGLTAGGGSTTAGTRSVQRVRRRASVGVMP